MEYLSSIVFHTVILKSFENEREKINLATFLYRGQCWNGVHLSSIVFHTVIPINFDSERK